MKAFLLGAGASVDAGLPASIDLTREVVDHVDAAPFRGKLPQLLHVVIGAMVQHDTGRGAGAFDGVDVERVFAAVRSLAERQSIDLAAFVERWNHNIDGVGSSPRLPTGWAKDIAEGVLGGFHKERNLEQAFIRGVETVLGGDGDKMFSSLQVAMLDALSSILQVDPGKVSYLRPIVDSEDLIGVATLNYDQSVELACAQMGRTFDTGLDTWRGGYDWHWGADVDVRLLKLHGSLDYVLGKRQAEGMRTRGDNLTFFGPRRPGSTLVGGSPAVVFGQGSKLRSDGPFLAMLVEFDRLLLQADWLTVVGYSFRDDHINAALARWLNSDSARRVSVIDPAIDSWNENTRTAPEFFQQLVGASRGRVAKYDHDFGFSALQGDFIPTGAAEGLAELHSS